MRRPVLLIFVNAMILLVVFALLAQSLVVVQRLAQAQALTGQVEVQRGGRGEFRALAPNAFVKTGDVVRTGSDGRAEFTWADGTRWKLLPGSLLTVKKSSTNTVRRSDQSLLSLSSGKMLVRVARALPSASRFEIETPSALARVRGTIFSIEIQGQKTLVQVWKGKVALSNPQGHSVAVERGQAGSVDPAVSAPQVRSDASIERLFAGEKSMARPPLWAEAQVLEEGRVLVSGRTEAGDEVRINGHKARVLNNGVFRLRLNAPPEARITVEARDKHGVASTWSGVASSDPVPTAVQ
jgi:hypothetical protein